MKIQNFQNFQPAGRKLPKPASPAAPHDSYQPQPFDRENNQRGYAHIARSVAVGAGIGSLAGAATQLVAAIPGVPVGMATALTASAGLVAGAWLGLAIGYASC